MSCSLGGVQYEADAKASDGHSLPLGSVVRDRASATWLNSEGRWPTTKHQRRRACLHESSRATAAMAPFPSSFKAHDKAAVLSPRTATEFSTNLSPQVHKESSNVANSQKL